MDLEAPVTGLGYCAPEPLGVSLWGIAFHLALFAAFFAAFFQFALRDRYSDMQNEIGKVMALLAQAEVKPNTRMAIASQMKELQERAVKGSKARERRNNLATGLSLIPIVVLWLIVIVSGALMRSKGAFLWPSVKGALIMFAVFLIGEMTIFKLVVTKYEPLGMNQIVQIYKDALLKKAKQCKYKPTKPVPPVVPIAKSF